MKVAHRVTLLSFIETTYAVAARMLSPGGPPWIFERKPWQRGLGTVGAIAGVAFGFALGLVLDTLRSVAHYTLYFLKNVKNTFFDTDAEQQAFEEDANNTAKKSLYDFLSDNIRNRFTLQAGEAPNFLHKLSAVLSNILDIPLGLAITLVLSPLLLVAFLLVTLWYMLPSSLYSIQATLSPVINTLFEPREALAPSELRLDSMPKRLGSLPGFIIGGLLSIPVALIGIPYYFRSYIHDCWNYTKNALADYGPGGQPAQEPTPVNGGYKKAHPNTGWWIFGILLPIPFLLPTLVLVTTILTNTIRTFLNLAPDALDLQFGTDWSNPDQRNTARKVWGSPGILFSLGFFVVLLPFSMIWNALDATIDMIRWFGLRVLFDQEPRWTGDNRSVFQNLLAFLGMGYFLGTALCIVIGLFSFLKETIRSFIEVTYALTARMLIPSEPYTLFPGRRPWQLGLGILGAIVGALFGFTLGLVIDTLRNLYDYTFYFLRNTKNTFFDTDPQQQAFNNINAAGQYIHPEAKSFSDFFSDRIIERWNPLPHREGEPPRPESSFLHKLSAIVSNSLGAPLGFVITLALSPLILAAFLLATLRYAIPSSIYAAQTIAYHLINILFEVEGKNRLVANPQYQTNSLPKRLGAVPGIIIGFSISPLILVVGIPYYFSDYFADCWRRAKHFLSDYSVNDEQAHEPAYRNHGPNAPTGWWIAGMLLPIPLLLPVLVLLTTVLSNTWHTLFNLGKKSLDLHFGSRLGIADHRNFARKFWGAPGYLLALTFNLVLLPFSSIFNSLKALVAVTRWFGTRAFALNNPYPWNNPRNGLQDLLALPGYAFAIFVICPIIAGLAWLKETTLSFVEMTVVVADRMLNPGHLNITFPNRRAWQKTAGALGALAGAIFGFVLGLILDTLRNFAHYTLYFLKNVKNIFFDTDAEQTAFANPANDAAKGPWDFLVNNINKRWNVPPLRPQPSALHKLSAVLSNIFAAPLGLVTALVLSPLLLVAFLLVALWHMLPSSLYSIQATLSPVINTLFEPEAALAPSEALKPDSMPKRLGSLPGFFIGALLSIPVALVGIPYYFRGYIHDCWNYAKNALADYGPGDQPPGQEPTLENGGYKKAHPNAGWWIFGMLLPVPLLLPALVWVTTILSNSLRNFLSAAFKSIEIQFNVNLPYHDPRGPLRKFWGFPGTILGAAFFVALLPFSMVWSAFNVAFDMVRWFGERVLFDTEPDWTGEGRSSFQNLLAFIGLGYFLGIVLCLVVGTFSFLKETIRSFIEINYAVAVRMLIPEEPRTLFPNRKFWQLWLGILGTIAGAALGFTLGLIIDIFRGLYNYTVYFLRNIKNIFFNTHQQQQGFDKPGNDEAKGPWRFFTDKISKRWNPPATTLHKVSAVLANIFGALLGFALTAAFSPFILGAFLLLSIGYAIPSSIYAFDSITFPLVNWLYDREGDNILRPNVNDELNSLPKYVGAIPGVAVGIVAIPFIFLPKALLAVAMIISLFTVPTLKSALYTIGHFFGFLLNGLFGPPGSALTSLKNCGKYLISTLSLGTLEDWLFHPEGDFGKLYDQLDANGLPPPPAENYRPLISHGFDRFMMRNASFGQHSLSEQAIMEAEERVVSLDTVIGEYRASHPSQKDQEELNALQALQANLPRSS